MNTTQWKMAAAFGLATTAAILLLGRLQYAHGPVHSDPGDRASVLTEATDSHPGDFIAVHSDLEQLRADNRLLEEAVRQLETRLHKLDQSQQLSLAGIEERQVVQAQELASQLADESTANEWKSAADEEAEMQAKIEAQVEALEYTLMAEVADSSWADKAAGTVNELLLSEEFEGVNLQSADCRTSMCRLDFGFDTSISGEAVFDKVMNFAPWPGQGFAQITEGPSPKAVMYLSREGFSLATTAD